MRGYTIERNILATPFEKQVWPSLGASSVDHHSDHREACAFPCTTSTADDQHLGAQAATPANALNRAGEAVEMLNAPVNALQNAGEMVEKDKADTSLSIDSFIAQLNRVGSNCRIQYVVLPCGKAVWRARTSRDHRPAEYTEAEIRCACDVAPNKNSGKMQFVIQHSPRWVQIFGAGGFYRSTKAKLREEGLYVAKGGAGAMRSCAADAAYTVVANLRPDLRGTRKASQNTFRESLLPVSFLPADDPTREDIQEVLASFHLQVLILHNIQPRKLIERARRLLLLRLEFQYEDSDEPAYHFTVFDAWSGAILDNLQDKAVVVDDADRLSANGVKNIRKGNQRAMKPFYATFPEAKKITILEVCVCQRQPAMTPEDFLSIYMGMD